MRAYASVEPATDRPKVFGMTASPTWNVKNPQHTLSTLEMIMHAKIVGVRDNIQELADHSPKATEVTPPSSS